jgi:hypothetical protein
MNEKLDILYPPPWIFQTIMYVPRVADKRMWGKVFSMIKNIFHILKYSRKCPLFFPFQYFYFLIYMWENPILYAHILYPIQPPPGDEKIPCFLPGGGACIREKIQTNYFFYFLPGIFQKNVFFSVHQNLVTFGGHKRFFAIIFRNFRKKLFFFCYCRT